MRRFSSSIVLSALLLAACGSNGNAQKERPAPIVEAVEVTSHRFIDRIAAVGTAHAREQVTLAAPVTERIIRLNFSDGDMVTAGQGIAVLAPGEETATLAGAMASTPGRTQNYPA